MKKNYFIALLFWAGMFSCSGLKKAPTGAVLSGKIAESTDSVFLVYFSGKKYKTPIREDGSFHLKIDSLASENMGFFSVGNNRASIYVERGDSLYITLDASADKFDETLCFSGIGAENNNFLAEEKILGRKHSLQFYDLLNRNEKALTASLDSLQNPYLAHLESAKNLSPAFYSIKARSFAYHWALAKLEFENVIPVEELSTDFLAYKKEFPLEDEQLFKLEVRSYRRYLEQTLQNTLFDSLDNRFGGRQQVMEAFQRTPNTVVSLQLRFLNQMLKVQTIKNELLYEIIGGSVEACYDGENIQALLDEYRSYSTDEKKEEEMVRMVELLSKLKKGSIAPEISGASIDGKPVSLIDFKGKYVYVDVWETGCGPCRREIPHLKKLEKDYHGKNIVFLSVSIDQNREAWERMVKDEQLSGVQIHAKGGWRAPFMDTYQIKGVPAFILVDPEGKLIDRSAPRPSTKEIRKVFDELKGGNEAIAMK